MHTHSCQCGGGVGTDSGGYAAAGSGQCACMAHLWRACMPWAGGTMGPGSPHCQLAQLSGRLCKMASRFCLSARISARLLSKLWICSCCCSDSCSKSLSFPCSTPGGPSCSLRRSSARWVSFRARAGAPRVSSDPVEGHGQPQGGLAPLQAPSPEALPSPNPPGFRVPTIYQEARDREGGVVRQVRAWPGHPTGLMCRPRNFPPGWHWATVNFCCWYYYYR